MEHLTVPERETIVQSVHSTLEKSDKGESQMSMISKNIPEARYNNQIVVMKPNPPIQPSKEKPKVEQPTICSVPMTTLASITRYESPLSEKRIGSP